MPDSLSTLRCRVAVIWIDWYAYHVARFRGIESAPALSGRVCGIELVGGIGVHAGLKFREALPSNLNIDTLMPDKSWREANHWELSKMLWARLTQLDPEVVLVPGYYTLPAFAAAIWARLHGRTSVLMTESTAGDHKRTWWKERLKGIGLRSLFGWAVSGGRAHVAYLADLGFQMDRVAGFYDVVDNEMFDRGSYLQRLQTAEEARMPERYFLYVGRLAEEKNVMGLLQSWLDYRESGGAWPLVLVGDGPERARLEAAAAASGLGGDVRFAGLRSSVELLPFYAHAGCFVLASTREPWGLVVNEAMASGLPVLVSASCGCATDLVLPGLNGFLFDPLDRPGLAELLRRMEGLTPEQHSRMGRYSAELIRTYSPQKFGLSVASIADGASKQGSLRTIQGGAR